MTAQPSTQPAVSPRERLIAACSTPMSPDPRVIRFRVTRAARAAFLARDLPDEPNAALVAMVQRVRKG